MPEIDLLKIFFLSRAFKTNLFLTRMALSRAPNIDENVEYSGKVKEGEKKIKILDPPV